MKGQGPTVPSHPGGVVERTSDHKENDTKLGLGEA